MLPATDSQATVHQLDSARTQRHAGGRVSSRGYDPQSGEESGGKGYEDDPIARASPEFDVFALVDQRGYTEARFYCKSTDSKGHGERQSIRIPQGIDSQIHAAVREIPHYATVQDFARDAFVHRLEYLQRRYSLSSEAQRMLELERIQADMERRAHEADTMDAAVHDLERRLQSLWDKEDWAMLGEELVQGGEMHDWLREPYKTRSRLVLEKWKKRAHENIARRSED